MSPRRRLFFGILTVVLALLAAWVTVSALRPGAPQTGRPSQDRLGPVLLVPGYGGGRDALEALADRIREETGRDTRVLTLDGDGTGDLLAQVKVLSEAAADAPSVDVIGYSAGGVVARLWTSRDGAHQARRIITLGAPLHGTRVAAIGGAIVPGGCPLACQQLAPGSPVLARMDAEKLPAGLPWLSVWSRDDRTVTPPESAELDGALNLAVQDVCPGVVVQHAELPTHPVVVRMVLAALGTEPLSVPSC
ncbi:esterase/lipase family protein [Amycolatopsis sp. cg5]|uniref:esterase/lipase family protein n=1 Tax=Amycolatopsis sp. cg5 TaxID=3238802 RepID=UPI003526A848